MLRKSAFITLIVVVAASFGFAFTSSPESEKALTTLMDGNKRFVSGASTAPDLGKSRLTELAGAQHPSAIIVTCSDSRVAPSHIFNQGLGDVFVIRVAGNVLDPISIGSIEYAAEHLHTPLLVIMGHDKCGAVSAALEAHGPVEGNIGAIVKKIAPAVKRAKAKGGSPDDILNNAIRENVADAYRDAIEKSVILKHLVMKGELKVVTAVYHLSSGEVEMIPASAPAAKAPVHAH